MGCTDILNNPLSEAPRSKHMGGDLDYFSPNMVIATHRPPEVACFAKALSTMQSVVIRSWICGREKRSFFRSIYVSTAPDQGRAEDCKSKSTYQNCNAWPHPSLCHKLKTPEPGMTPNGVGNNTVIQPVVVIKFGRYKFRALLDNDTSHSYTRSTAIELTKVHFKSMGL